MGPADFVVVEALPPRREDDVTTNSDEALTAWTPVLGPTAMLLAYRFAKDISREGITTYVVSDLALDLGVAPAKVMAAVKRLHRYKVAVVAGYDVGIRLRLPPPPTTPGPDPEALTLTIPEAAALLGISRAGAYQAARNGDIPTVQIGRRLLVPKARLLAMISGA